MASRTPSHASLSDGCRAPHCTATSAAGQSSSGLGFPAPPETDSAPETDSSLCNLQSKLRKDAAAAQVEQQKKEKEAVQAANEATLAQLNEQHNLVRCLESRALHI